MRRLPSPHSRGELSSAILFPTTSHKLSEAGLSNSISHYSFLLFESTMDVIKHPIDLPERFRAMRSQEDTAYITPITQEKDAAIETTIVEVETVAEREGRHGAQEEEKEEAERRQEIGGSFKQCSKH